MAHIARLPIQTRILSQACYRYADVVSCAVGAVDVVNRFVHTEPCSGESYCTWDVDRSPTTTFDIYTSMNTLLCNVLSPTANSSCTDHCGEGLHCTSNEEVHGAVGVVRRLLCDSWMEEQAAGTCHPSVVFLRCTEGSPWMDVSCLCALSRRGTFSVQLLDSCTNDVVSEVQLTLAVPSQEHQDHATSSLHRMDSLAWEMSSQQNHDVSSAALSCTTSGLKVQITLGLHGVFERVPLRCHQPKPHVDSGVLSTVDQEMMAQLSQHLVSDALQKGLNGVNQRTTLTMSLQTGCTNQLCCSSLLSCAEGPLSDDRCQKRRLEEVYVQDLLRSMYTTTNAHLVLSNDGHYHHAHCPTDDHDDEQHQWARVHSCSTADCGVVLQLFDVQRPTSGGRRRCLPGLIVMVVRQEEEGEPHYHCVRPDHSVYKMVSNAAWSRRLESEGRIVALAVVYEPRLVISMRGLRSAMDAAVATTAVNDATSPPLTMSRLLSSTGAVLATSGQLSTTAAGYAVNLRNAAPKAVAPATKVFTSLLKAQNIVRRAPSDAQRSGPRGPVRTMACLDRYQGSTVPASAVAVRQQMPVLSVGEWTSRSLQTLNAICPGGQEDEDHWRTIMTTSTVVGVWDKKCIVLAPPPPVTTQHHPHHHQQLLYLCDQHAIHERTRLEYFVRHVASYVSSHACAAPYATVPATHSHDCTQLLAPLESLGWRFSSSHNITTTMAAAQHLQMIAHPRVTIEGFVYDVATMEALTNTIEELCDVGGGSAAAVSQEGALIGDVIPSAVLQILVSRSCRGAVMFGDALSLEDATLLVRSATTYVRKFLECSHGRPSFAVCDPRTQQSHVSTS